MSEYTDTILLAWAQSLSGLEYVAEVHATPSPPCAAKSGERINVEGSLCRHYRMLLPASVDPPGEPAIPAR